MCVRSTPTGRRCHGRYRFPHEYASALGTTQCHGVIAARLVFDRYGLSPIPSWSVVSHGRLIGIAA